MSINIAIDGPAGAGKSTMARRLAADMGFLYVDTGAMYRAVGLHVYRAGKDPTDEEAVRSLLPEIRIGLSVVDGEQHISLNGEDVNKAIREPVMSDYASKVAALGSVREFLLETQRSIARRENVIMDGRDIGTAVLPDAQLKVFLTADVKERARRRFAELREKGTPADFGEVLKDMEERDRRDREREISPLRCAEDAVVLDTTELSAQGVVDALKHLAEEKLGYGL